MYFKNKSPPCISYKYTKTISSSIFNHNKAVQEFSADAYREGSYTCECSSSPFQYNPHGHVVTGDISFFENSSLRDIIRRGPKYREPRRDLME